MGKPRTSRTPSPAERAQHKALLQAREMIAEIAQRNVNEAETSHHVKSVFTDVLGYDQFRHLTYEHAVRGLGSTDHVDLAITLDEGGRAKPVMLIELKRVGVELAHKHIKQASAYAIHTGLPLTNPTVRRGVPEIAKHNMRNTKHKSILELGAVGQCRVQ